MKYKISSDVENETNCRDNFSCLSGDDTCFCEYERYIEGDSGVLFIKPKYEDCDYKMSFGDSIICNCPARKEIYKNHKI